jgi:glutamate N-acetyltransferase/amino-acid N-acetyltransferase
MQNVAYPKGFRATGVACGIKKSGAPDLGILISEPAAQALGALTRNRSAAAPVLFDREILSSGKSVSHVIVNSGCANAATGDRGMDDARSMAQAVREAFRTAGEVFVSSTGVIGEFLPMEKIHTGIIALAAEKATGTFQSAIMTTDTREKACERSLILGGVEVRIGGVAKGAGMIRPDMATMLAYLTTDIALDSEYKTAFTAGVDRSFNSISVDGDMSTNDTVLLLANGASGVSYRQLSAEDRTSFDAALFDCLLALAQAIVDDGEGATHRIEVRVRGAASEEDARSIARAIANSPLVKTAFFGGDANWGRLVSAAGSALVPLELPKLRVDFCGVTVYQGEPRQRDEAVLAEKMREREVSVELDLGLGTGTWDYWTCDLSYDYVKINGSYRS